jgi:hypothetical protein
MCHELDEHPHTGAAAYNVPYYLKHAKPVRIVHQSTGAHVNNCDYGALYKRRKGGSKKVTRRKEGRKQGKKDDMKVGRK